MFRSKNRYALFGNMLRGEGIADEFIRIVDDYVARRFGAGPA
ncbi:hypothetical protein [Methylocystis heyeri]|nr:hypothetical protein [Methylocystis heyeri]